MKKISRLFIAIGLICFLLTTSGCFGKFALTRKVYQWNESIGGNDLAGKFVKTLVMYGLMIVPVYEIAGTVDFVILNLIEFWTGSNPLSMNSDQKELQILEYAGISYEITATQNKFEIKQLTGDLKGTVQSFTFNPEELSWTHNIKGNSSKLIQYAIEDGEMLSVTYFGANGQTFVINEAQMNNTFKTFALK